MHGAGLSSKGLRVDCEPYIATSALGEIGRRRGDEARLAATTIIEAGSWDRHLFAFALTTLGEIDQDLSTTVMSGLVEQMDYSTILGAMVECVLAHVEYYERRLPHRRPWSSRMRCVKKRRAAARFDPSNLARSLAFVEGA